MIKTFALAWGLIVAALAPAAATPLVADLSQYRIEMDASFNGTRLFLFGVRNDSGDVVVVVRGPERDFMVRKKEPVAGIWVNSGRMKFFGVPDFYAVASSRPLEEIGQPQLLGLLGIGEPTLFSPPSDPARMATFNEYSQAFLRAQEKRKLYRAIPAELDFMAETLFKTTITFPDTIPPGEYTAEIYLLDEGGIKGMQSTPIVVTKTGLDAFLYRFAHQSPTLYGLCAVAMALAAGWFAGRLFSRS
jgi:uncharacterized protein (TIGR02186 family)